VLQLILSNVKSLIFISDEKRMLKLIPKGNKKAAKLLLNEFNERANELTWDSNGIVYIDQVAIPGSNMYFIFPFLFKKKRSSQLPGMREVFLKINDMGLGDFIISSEPKKDEASKSTPENSDLTVVEKWWYLGP
jgi:hypothetical protein